MNRLLPALLLLGLLGCHLERSCPSLALPGDEATSAPDTFPEDTPAGEDAATEEVAQIPAPLVLNEIRCTSGDWVELRNLGTAPLSDLGGWTLTDDPGNPDHVWSLPADLEIAGGARVVLLQADGDAPGFPFGLKCGEDTVTLLAPGGVEADAVALPVLAEGLTWGRIPDGTGAWAENVPTPAALNQGTAPPPTTDIADLIFDPFRVLPVEITLPPTSIDSLWAQPKEYVPATFRVASGHGMAPPRPIGIRIKGAWGSFRDLNGKTAFKVSFVFQDGEPWLGREHITLNNMVQDPSMLHEVVAYNLFRAMGIPCPRVGYAWVTVNGVPYGLYALLEPYDDVFLERVFPEGTGHLYENVYFVDVTPGNAPAFDVDEGDPEDLSDIEALIVANHHTPDAYWMETMAAFTHLPEMIRMWAVEQYIGHWDGYAPSVNNFFLHSDPGGVFTMLPWGTDQTFGDFRDYHSGGGVLFVRCMGIPACRLLFDQALFDLLQILEGRNDASFIQDLAAFLSPWVQKDPRKPYSTDDVAAHVQGTLDFLASRWPDCMEVVGCSMDPAADADGDGYSCALDCDETDPQSHQGAPDLCGDGVDQDCNGWIDDGWDCPDCQEVWRGDHRTLVCPTPRPFWDVAAHCQAFGSQPLILESAFEEAWVHGRLQERGIEGAWLPLTDLETEGIFLWSDGSPPAYQNWSPGEPNNWGEEDCAEMFTWGGWNDVVCDAPHPVLCEDPCTPGQDDDGDGHLRCDDDCDDGDPLTHPGAKELCGDGVDQDCNGMADDSETCVDTDLLAVTPAVHGWTFLRIPAFLPRDTARKVCLAQAGGGDLAWFASPGEQAVVHEALAAVAGDADHWIGLNDLVAEGVWLWAGGEVPSFTSWAPDQPNDGGGSGQDCVRLLTDGTWNDTDCVAVHPAVCRLPDEG